MSKHKDIPAIGFGTFGRNGPEGIAAISYALETGYRHIDTAQSYDTETECGHAIAASGLPRNEIFITTKITMENYGPGALIPSLEQSLQNLQIDQLDLTLIHWPVSPEGPASFETILPQLAAARQQGLTRLIGVSNFTIADIERAKTILGDQPIANNQFELHPYLQNRKLAAHCKTSNIAVTCYCPLGQGIVANDPVLGEIGKKHGATASQIALAFSMARGLIVIPTSGKRDRIKSNFQARDIILDTDDITQIEQLDRGHRVINPEWSPHWD